MSIQNRLLLVYALIFSIVYILSSLVIYILPRNQLLAQIDGDLYSLAATLVHLATGETLYAGSWLDQVDAHTRAPLPDLRARRPELSPAFVRLLAVMLEKNPAQRPANAHDVALALRAIMP